MGAKDYMVDVADIPKYGPPNMADSLYEMIRGIPQAYQEGVENRFKNVQAQRLEDLQKPILDENGNLQKDPIKYSEELARRYPEQGLDYPLKGLTVKAYQDYYGKPQQPPANDFPLSGQPRRSDAGGGGPLTQDTVASLVSGAPGFADQPNAAASIARQLGIDPDQKLTAGQAEAIRKYVLRDAADAPEEDTGSSAPVPGAVPGPDPRTGPPPNMQPGQMPGMPASVGPGASAPMGPQGFRPMVPPGVTGQAGPAPNPTQNPAAGMQPFVQPPTLGAPPAAPPAPAPGTPKLLNQDEINARLNKANQLEWQGNRSLVPQEKADLIARANVLRKTAEQAQKALDEVAGKVDPAILAKERDQAIEKGDITAGQKEAGRLQTEANTARRANQQLAVMRTKMADPDFYSGAGHEAVKKYKEWIAALPGGNPNAAAPMQEFHKTTMEMLNQRIQNAVASGYSRIQLREIENMQKQIANLDVSQATNRYIMEEMSRIHQMDIKLNDFSNQYIQSHGYLDRGWPAAREAFMSRPENRLFTDEEINHPERIAPSYYPSSYVGDVAKTKAFINNQKLKPSDPVMVDDRSKPPGPDGLYPRKITTAGHILSITVGRNQ